MSERRATAVSGYLEGQAYNQPSRLTIKGLWREPFPNTKTKQPKGRTENRRVEFLITANEKMKAEAAKTASN
ncbi:MAG: hypothetical protein U5L72_06045 [Bacteroidales bacterium]|nr:hypothetical protein [Bacteroidales bacterium]